jgi:hypothetical protein
VLFEAYRQRRNQARGDKAGNQDKSPGTPSKPKKLKGLGS